MPRHTTPLLTVLLLAASPGVALAAHGDYVGKTTNRNGTTTLRFTTQFVPNTMTLRVSAKAARRVATYRVSCRVDGRYTSLFTARPLHAGTRTMQSPGDLPAGATRCRVTRSGHLLATLKLRRVP